MKIGGPAGRTSVITLLSLYVWIAASSGATLTVTSLNDSGSGTLRNTLAAAASGDTIQFSVTGQIKLGSTVSINKNVTISGPGQSQLAITRDSGNFILLEIGGGVTASMSDIAVTGGQGDGRSPGGIENAGNLTLTFCTLSGNAGFQGGAIYNLGSITATQCAFDSNTADDGGAAIWNAGGQVTVSFCSFISNSGTGAEGGAITNYGSAQTTINNCTFNSNTSEIGGALTNFSFGSDLGTFTVRNSSFNNNSASKFDGGAVYIGLGTAAIVDCTFSGNNAVGSGGAVVNYEGNLTLRNCTLANNSAAIGGGVVNEGRDNPSQASATVSNCTLSNNSAPNGGGIYNAELASGAGVSLTIDNTILFSTDSTPGANLINTGGASVTSQGYNLSSDNASGQLTAHGDQINTDPKLGPLQDNGGPTLTMALLAGSPALDQGNNFNVTTDQRGLPRPIDNPAIPNAVGGDGSDIGAVEMDPMQTGPAFTVTTTDDHNDGTCSLADCSLREAVLAANGTAGANTITFAPNVTGTIALSLGSLTVSDSTTIIGPGARSLAVDGKSLTAIFVFTGGTSTISGLTIQNGKVTGSSGQSVSGGGVSNAQNTVLTIADCALLGNNAQGGDNTTAAGAAGGNGNGGAIGNSGTLMVSGCTLSANTATGGHGDNAGAGGNSRGGAGGTALGAGIFNNTGATLTVVDSTFSGNSTTGGAGGGGLTFGGDGGDAAGAVFNMGTMTVTSATLKGNTGTGGAGGAGTLRDGNAGNGFGALVDRSNASTIANTISAGNTGSGLGGGDADGTFTSQGYNLLGIGDFSAGFTAMGDQVGTTAAALNPKLGPLQNNGGPTETMALLVGSPAIDAGQAFGLPGDQRGSPRTVDIPDVANAPGSDGTDIGAVELVSLPVVLGNISTRLSVGTGDNVLIGGFIIGGTQAKKVIVRAIGPSLPFANDLANPTLELHDSAGNLLFSNDDWVDSPNKQAIIDSTIPPSNDLESAIVANLPSNNAAYTAIVSGVNGTTGIGLVEVYDLNGNVDSKLANISTRGLVQSGNDVMIAGTIVVGSDLQKVLIRGLGPSLTVPGALADPTLELHDGNGVLLEANDNWMDSPNKQAIIDTTIPPTNNLESAILRSLPPGNYTAILSGVNGATGIALVEIYALN